MERFNKLYITCNLLELLAQIKEILPYGMWCGKTSGIMACLILTRVVIHQLAVPWKSAILEIFFIESTSEFQTAVTFFICERKHKVWVIIFLVRS